MTAVSTWSPADISSPLERRAERIRSLVTTARTCIVEVGRELIEAREEIPHGEWLPWLEREFGWSDRTARNYISAAEAFKSETVSDLAGINLTAKALYILSAPEVPLEVRTEAVQRAEAGETITKKAAEEMVRKAEARNGGGITTAGVLRRGTQREAHARRKHCDRVALISGKSKTESQNFSGPASTASRQKASVGTSSQNRLGRP